MSRLTRLMSGKLKAQTPSLTGTRKCVPGEVVSRLGPEGLFSIQMARRGSCMSDGQVEGACVPRGQYSNVCPDEKQVGN